jgi:hypothetical protein
VGNAPKSDGRSLNLAIFNLWILSIIGVGIPWILKEFV